MSKQQHIDYWINSAKDDWFTVDILFASKRYSHCLFFAHLTLEKIAKSHWVKNHEENIPPKIHNIVWLLVEFNINLGNEKMNFLTEFNDFQLSTRYPDYQNNIFKICNDEFTQNMLKKVKEIRQCLIEML
jgi:HEPN domain-containing protein